ncbi:helix-turn-helix domain-containing protein [Emticicia sp. ODNR4P]|nr:helix-turn-helix domain-containing protein [Emticicia sp. ODNR4P]
MENLKKLIDEARKKKGYSIRNLALKIGMTEAGYYAMLRNNSAKLRILEKLSEELSIPLGTLLEANELTEGQQFILVNTENNSIESEWKTKYEESQRYVKALLKTIEQLTMGKHNPVFQSQTVAA